MTRFPIFRNAICSDKPHGIRLAIALALVFAATVLRVAFTALDTHLVFVTYYPAVLISSVLAGWRYGLLSAILAGIIAQTYFATPGSLVADASTVINLSLFMISCLLIVATGDTLRRSVRELEKTNRLADNLNRELQHRVSNMITVVQALISQSAKVGSPEGFVATLNARLQALATAHALLGRRVLQSCILPEIIDEACKPFCLNGNISKSGPLCELPSASCVPLVLALHELCTNALKHGALSRSEGRVSITWSLADRPARVVIEWLEIGGPVVPKPTRKGLGSALLRAQPGLAGVELSFEPDGVCCRISIDGAVTVGVSDRTPPVAAEPVASATF